MVIKHIRDLITIYTQQPISRLQFQFLCNTARNDSIYHMLFQDFSSYYTYFFSTK